MKEKNNYSALWQEKRNQWPVEGDANADWLQMHSVLDSHLPVSGLIKKPYNPGRLKWIYKFFIGVSITATVAGGVYLSLSKKHNDASRNATVKESRVAIPYSSTPDVVNKTDNGNQVQKKTAVIKNENKNGKNDGSLVKPPIADSVQAADLTKNMSSPRRDSVFLPVTQTSPHFGVDSVSKNLRPINLNNHVIQKASTDSVKKSTKKRHSLGVFL